MSLKSNHIVLNTMPNVFVDDGRMRVWRHKITTYAPKNIQPTVLYDGGSVMVWGVSLMTASWI
jgi:hypothetical protein